MQQLSPSADLPAPASELLLGLQPGVRLSELRYGGHALREAAGPVLHDEPGQREPLPDVQRVALTIREISRRGTAARRQPRGQRQQ